MLEKITEQDLEQYGVVSAPDELKGTPADVKAVFDRLVKEVVAKAVNEIVEAHNALDTDVNARIDGIAEELKNVSEINVDNLGANNIMLDKKGETTLAEQYGLTSLVPNVHEALAKLGPIGTGAEALSKIVPRADYLANPDTFLKAETAALFGLDETAVPDDVLMAISNGFSRIVSGTVTGSFRASEDSPNSVTFPFKPKLVIVSAEGRSTHYEYSSMRYGWFVWVPGVEKDRVGDYGYGLGYRHYKQDGNTLSWWVEQGKTEDTTYASAVVGPYVAFG